MTSAEGVASLRLRSAMRSRRTAIETLDPRTASAVASKTEPSADLSLTVPAALLSTVPGEHVLPAHEARDIGRLGPVVDDRSAVSAWSMRPVSMTTTMSASAIASGCVWVTWTKVMPSSFCRLFNSPRIRRRRNSSSADSGSSRSSTRGLVISERASATRCCWPPDKLRRHAIFQMIELNALQHLLRACAGALPYRRRASSDRRRHCRGC